MASSVQEEGVSLAGGSDMVAGTSLNHHQGHPRESREVPGQNGVALRYQHTTPVFLRRCSPLHLIGTRRRELTSGIGCSIPCKGFCLLYGHRTEAEETRFFARSRSRQHEPCETKLKVELRIERTTYGLTLQLRRARVAKATPVNCFQW